MPEPLESPCRSDVYRAMTDLRNHLIDDERVRGVGIHGRKKEIIVFVYENCKVSAKLHRIEEQGWFGWPVQVVRLG